MSDIDQPTGRSKSGSYQRVIWMLAVVMCSAALWGCQTASREGSATAGLAMTMYVRDVTGAESYYEVDPKGLFRFGGGLKARLFQTTWATAMTPAEIARVRTELANQSWFRPTPQSTNLPAEHLYRVTIDAPERRKQFKVKGEHHALHDLQEIFSKIALRRLEPTLRSLPEPSIKQSTTQPGTRPGS